ncbi:hypothetical protein G6711_02765 [Polynucleobacter paneuropaeus]|nr:hypothetical protein [Polynucleobacter paneuropaeus]
MDILDDEAINKLLETYQYVYLTELDHRENIKSICEEAGIELENCAYYPMWERSKKALSSLEDLIKLNLDKTLNGLCLRNQLEKHRTLFLLENKDIRYIEKILKL